MKPKDTSLGGAQRAFPETTWSMIARLAETGRGGEALEQVCRRYWKPVYYYVRTAWGKSNDESKDLAQAFFLWLMEADPLRSYVRERGGFRAFLRVLLRRFVGHQEVAVKRLKRGGGVRIVPLEPELSLSDPKGTDPESEFDRAWVSEVVEQAIERVRKKTEPTAFCVYEGYDLASAERPTYTQLAADLHIDEKAVKKHLFQVREAVRSEIRAELRELTGDDSEREEEWKSLFGGR